MGDPGDIVVAALADDPRPPTRVTRPPGPDGLLPMEWATLGAFALAAVPAPLFVVSVPVWAIGLYLLLTRTRWARAERLAVLFVPIGLSAPWVGAISTFLSDLRCEITTAQGLGPSCGEATESVIGLVGVLGLGELFVGALATVAWLRTRVRRRPLPPR